MTVLFYDLAFLAFTCEQAFQETSAIFLKNDLPSRAETSTCSFHRISLLPGNIVRPHFPEPLAVRHLGAAM